MNQFQNPKVSKRGRVNHVSYELPHRVYCAKTYPIKTRNGSTIILYGHGSGLKLVWRGGRPSKRSAADSTNEGAQLFSENSETSVPKAAFEEKSEALDPSGSFASVIQDLDLELGTQVLKIAVPPLPSQQRAGVPIPNIFEERMIIAVACGDASVKVLSIPLDAPSEIAKQKLSKLSAKSYAAVAELPSGPATYRSPATHVALTWTSPDASQSQEETGQQFGLLLASTGADLSGTLLLTRVTLHNKDGRSVLESGAHLPFQKLHLSSQPISIAFNPSTYPSRRHTQLLVAETNGSARVYDPLPHLSRHIQAGSDGDSIMSSREAITGTWVASFATTYQCHSTAAADLWSPGLARRKPLLAAQWALQGHSIIALTTDGEFGFWDTNSPNIGGLKARALLTSGSSSDDRSSKSRGSTSGLAPMTPNTRAAKAERLFSSSAPAPTSTIPQGGFDVMTRSSSESDESVIIWYGNGVHSISNIQAFRERSEEGTRGTGSLYGPGLSRFEGIDLRNENISSVVQLPFSETSRDSHSQPDIVVAADSRLIVLCKLIASSPFGDRSALIRMDEDAEMVDEEEQERADMDMLDREELGLAGIDKLANSMSGSRLFGRSAGRKVLFAAS